MLRGWMEGIHARNLGDRGFGADLGYCSAIDTIQNVPVLVEEDDVDSVECPVLLVR
jgi:phosphosulfolactate phosphohydrolase-like enzyme